MYFTRSSDGGVGIYKNYMYVYHNNTVHYMYKWVWVKWCLFRQPQYPKFRHSFRQLKFNEKCFFCLAEVLLKVLTAFF